MHNDPHVCYHSLASRIWFIQFRFAVQGGIQNFPDRRCKNCIGCCHPRSSSLPHIDTSPTISSIFWMLPGSPFLSEQQITLCNSACISSVVSNWRPFSFNFIFGNRKKLQGAKSWEYSGWGMTAILLFTRNCWVRTDMWDRALSWWSSQVLVKVWMISSHVFTHSPQNVAVEPEIHSLACWGEFFVHKPPLRQRKWWSWSWHCFSPLWLFWPWWHGAFPLGDFCFVSGL